MYKRKRAPAGRNLPRLNNSVVINSEKNKAKYGSGLSPKNPIKRKTSAYRKRDESSISSSLQAALEAADSEDLTEIKEARAASRKAIDVLMKGIKKQHRMPVWVPSGEQAKFHHVNAQQLSPRPVKSKF